MEKHISLGLSCDFTLFCVLKPFGHEGSRRGAVYFEGQHSSDKRPAVDLGDVSSLRQGDGPQLFDRIHRHVHLASSFRVVTSANTIHLKIHIHTQGTETHKHQRTDLILTSQSKLIPNLSTMGLKTWREENGKFFKTH